jgi:hypothetical protein
MDDEAAMSDEARTTDELVPPKPHRHWYRLALGATILMVVAVLTLLPIAVTSMQEVLGRAPDTLYDLVTGQPIDPATVTAAEDEGIYGNLGIIGLDESTGLLTIAVSGNRNCKGPCPTTTMTLVALDDDADQRRGLPPSATLTLQPEDTVFSQSVQLPLRGQPSLYPFDTYTIWLGAGGTATYADGTVVEFGPTTLGGRVLTLQNRIGDMVMLPPVPVDSRDAQAQTDPFAFLTVQSLTFGRPAYLEVLAIVLVLLITISAALALFTRTVNELALGVGGLILGVWGIRSILMPTSLSTVTAIDLALSWVILLLLLGFAVHAALHFHRHSDLPLPRPQRNR